MTVADLVKQLREYFSACMAEGFTATEAMTLTQAYQTALLQNDMIERLQNKGEKPWER